MHYYSGDFINGKIEGRGYYDYDLCVFSNGKLIKNLSLEARVRAHKIRKEKEDCENCIINQEETVFPVEEEKEGWFSEYTETTPGKIIMKNGEIYTYWYDKAEIKPWRIIDKYGIFFNDYKNFETFDDMLEALIEKCINTKCKEK